MLAALLASAVAATAPNGLASDVSIMSYNVHGLPWPIAARRPTALREIGARLAEMRAAGTEPHLVLLQEAFTADAKAIGKEAGYPYVVRGPDREERSKTPADFHQEDFGRAANRLKGEGDGTVEDSGLLILSDYPVLDIRRMPYSRFACAGFDCLANKGVLLVKVAIPGTSDPLVVIDTHLNSRGASGVRRSRADMAFAWQAVQLREFVGANVPSSAPAVVAGDFNIGRITYRQEIIGADNPALEGADDALRAALAGKAAVQDKADAEAIAEKGKDWMFVRSGTATTLKLQEVAVPFGRDARGKSLSDHLGYVSYYALQSTR